MVQTWEDRRVHTFPKGICPKVNVTARPEFELVHYDSVISRFNHFTTIQLGRNTVIFYQRSDFNMVDNLSIAVHTFTNCMLSVEKILLTMYLNGSTNFRGMQLEVEMIPSCLKHMRSILFALSKWPVYYTACSRHTVGIWLRQGYFREALDH